VKTLDGWISPNLTAHDTHIGDCHRHIQTRLDRHRTRLPAIKRPTQARVAVLHCPSADAPGYLTLRAKQVLAARTGNSGYLRRCVGHRRPTRRGGLVRPCQPLNLAKPCWACMAVTGHLRRKPSVEPKKRRHRIGFVRHVRGLCVAHIVSDLGQIRGTPSVRPQPCWTDVLRDQAREPATSDRPRSCRTCTEG